MLSRDQTSRCDNSSLRAGGAIVAPACAGNLPTRTVTITYNEVESDSLRLCDECSKTVATDARRHGYGVSGAAR